ncbi:Fc.00g095100.m01.CDS01 [Cosmosporella sp. VM-42]
MSRGRPPLKNGVDLQLQSAFSDGTWPVVIRLAEKRARTLNDQYYEIVKLCAESQLDDPNAKIAAVSAISQFIKDGTVIKDVDAINLLEWATGDLTDEDDFAETLGPLRVRLVKAAPKDGMSATKCLESCLLHWDLVSAQQIATILDRSHPQKETFMFWNILITHLLATSSQSPPEKKKLYGMLALKQIQRAAQAAEQADGAKGHNHNNPPPRSVQSEEEVLLMYDVLEKHGTKDDFGKLMTSPLFSPLAQFRRGRKEPVLRVLAKNQRESDWEAVYQLCKDCLSNEDENGQPSLLASDWVVWRQFILAAGQIKTTNPDTEKAAQDLLVKFVKASNLRPIYRRNILLARVSAAFNLASHDGDDLSDGRAASLRLRELIGYIQDQTSSAALFDDIKGFVEQLSPLGMKHLAFEHTPRLADEIDGQVNSARVRTLALKLQYFVSTCPSMYTNVPGETRLKKCLASGEDINDDSCSPSFVTIAQAALKLHQSLADIATDHPAVETEIRPDLAILIALCNIQQAFPPSADRLRSPKSYQPLVRALLILEHQLSLTPKHGAISLVLVQLHLLLGAAPRGREIWETLGVKRTIMDSLAPIFYDRLSTVAPGIVSPSDHNGWQLIEMLESHYDASLKLRMHRRISDAFETNSYGSILSIPHYIEDLRWGCTRVMSLVEEARTERIFGQQFLDVFQDPRFTEVTDDIQLKEVIDYGSFPSWGCSSCPPVYVRLQVGPASTNRRSHLSLLSEEFHQTLTYKAPPAYKPSATASAPEQIFVLETLSQLCHSFTKFLHGPEGDLTQQEAVYFEVISLLCTLIPFSSTIDRSAPLSDVFIQILDAVKAAMDNLQAGIVQDSETGAGGQIRLLSSLHAVAMFRDTASAVKQASQWILAFSEREKERDRSGKSNLPKEVITQIKGLQSAADAALKEGQGLIVKLKGQVFGRDFEPHVRKWIFEDGNEFQGIVGEDAVTRLVDSWEANIKGWTQVKWM